VSTGGAVVVVVAGLVVVVVVVAGFVVVVVVYAGVVVVVVVYAGVVVVVVGGCVVVFFVTGLHLPDAQSSVSSRSDASRLGGRCTCSKEDSSTPSLLLAKAKPRDTKTALRFIAKLKRSTPARG
jgi:hypothetical protein